MKIITKITTIAAIAAAISTSVVFADDQQLENRLTATQSETTTGNQPTIAFDASQFGIGKILKDAETPTRYEQLRYDGHGETTGAYVPRD